jgi:hypothetical protein
MGPRRDALLRSRDQEAVETALADPEALTGVARRIVALAHDLGCDHLLGASRLGERLASAAWLMLVATCGCLISVGRHSTCWCLMGLQRREPRPPRPSEWPKIAQPRV